MIYIGIDISKLSTAVTIERNNKTFLYNYTTKKKNNKWISDVSDYINFRYVNYKYRTIEDYSEREMVKFDEFEVVSEMIINDIIENINLMDSVTIGIEGFSYGSSVGPIIDLVELSTLIKHKIKSRLGGMITINIISPLTLKTVSCEAVYGPTFITKGKRVIKQVKVIQNPNGTLGKNFDKKDMFNMLIDSDIKLEIRDFLTENKDIILKNKELPKPYDDVVDSCFLKELVKNQHINRLKSS